VHASVSLHMKQWQSICWFTAQWVLLFIPCNNIDRERLSPQPRWHQFSTRLVAGCKAVGLMLGPGSYSLQPHMHGCSVLQLAHRAQCCTASCTTRTGTRRNVNSLMVSL